MFHNISTLPTYVWKVFWNLVPFGNIAAALARVSRKESRLIMNLKILLNNNYISIDNMKMWKRRRGLSKQGRGWDENKLWVGWFLWFISFLVLSRVLFSRLWDRVGTGFHSGRMICWVWLSIAGEVMSFSRTISYFGSRRSSTKLLLF